jgi:hypothetical protein
MFTVMRKIFADKNKQEELFLSGPGKDLEFTVVRPGGLKNDPPNGEHTHTRTCTRAHTRVRSRIEVTIVQLGELKSDPHNGEHTHTRITPAHSFSLAHHRPAWRT